MKRKLLESVMFTNGRGEIHSWMVGRTVEIVHCFNKISEAIVRSKTVCGMRRARVPFRAIGLKEKK